MNSTAPMSIDTGRQLVLETATTGGDPESGHRIVEFVLLELVAGRPTGRLFHACFNPERPVPKAATSVHGLRMRDLEGAPTFATAIPTLVDFMRGATIVGFDLDWDFAFLRSEFSRAGRRFRRPKMVIDILERAKRLYPQGGNSLEGLCDRLSVDRRTVPHTGTAADALLLARVFVALTK